MRNEENLLQCDGCSDNITQYIFFFFLVRHHGDYADIMAS